MSPSSLGPKTFKLSGSTHDWHGLSPENPSEQSHCSLSNSGREIGWILQVAHALLLKRVRTLRVRGGPPSGCLKQPHPALVSSRPFSGVQMVVCTSSHCSPHMVSLGLGAAATAAGSGEVGIGRGRAVVCGGSEGGLLSPARDSDSCFTCSHSVRGRGLTSQCLLSYSED